MPAIDDLMASHIIWKVNLRRLIKGDNANFPDIAVVQRDDLCDLGRWLYGEGAQFKGIEVYDEVLKKHAVFHQCAASVIRHIENGDRAGANAIVSSNLESLSRGLVDAFVELKKRVS